MASRKVTEKGNTTVKATPFTVEWPQQLQIEPILKVEVSPTRSAYVYNDSKREDGEERPCYRVLFVITRTGRPPQNELDDYRYRRGYTLGDVYESLLDVRLAIDAYSAANQPKVKTVTQKVKVEVNNDDEGDEE